MSQYASMLSMNFTKEKNMKNIIIGGSCRAGKSLLAKELMHHLKGVSFYGTDHIRHALMMAYPDKNFDKDNWNEYRTVVFNLFKSNKKYNSIGLYVIFEGNHFSIDEYLEKYKEEDTIAVFVGKPRLNEQEYFDNIRCYDKVHHTWTTNHSDEDVKKWVAGYHKKNIEEEKRCKELGIYYLDTSYNQMEVIKEFAKNLLQEIDEEHTHTI